MNEKIVNPIYLEKEKQIIKDLDLIIATAMMLRSVHRDIHDDLKAAKFEPQKGLFEIEDNLEKNLDKIAKYLCDETL